MYNLRAINLEFGLGSDEKKIYLIFTVDLGADTEKLFMSMFWSKNEKNRHTPAYPSFAI